MTQLSILTMLRHKMSNSVNACVVCSPITLVVAKCWDPNPKGYLTMPRQEPVRPIDPSAWVNHTEAVRNMEMWGRTGPPSVSAVTSTSSSLISSVPANERKCCLFYYAPGLRWVRVNHTRW